MSVNAFNLSLSIEQAGKVLNTAFKQATGQEVISQLATGDYTSIATMAQRVGYETMTNALSQVLTRTYIRVRSYSAKFADLVKTEEQYGNMVRKITYIDRDIPEGDLTRDIGESNTYSPYKVRKPQAVQTAFYGFNHIDDYITIFKNQWDTALSSGSELQRFISGIMTEWYNKLEQYHEQYSRATLINLIGGTQAYNKDTAITGANLTRPEMVRHLLTEYNTEHGTTLTRDALLADRAAFTQFAEDLAYKMDIIVRQMGERTVLYHVSPVKSITEDGATVVVTPIKRHTPRENLQCYMLAPFWDMVKRIVRPGLFANEYLEYIKFNEVTFWQNIEKPEQINADVSFFKPVESKVSGSKTTYSTYNTSGDATVELPYVLGVMFDDEAAAICYKNMWSAATPMNPAHGFQTNYIHEDVQWRNDNTENCCVLLFD
jgi:hypothetical protein